jgi:hypothetical protein
MTHLINKPSPNLRNSTKTCFMVSISHMKNYNEFINCHTTHNLDHLTKYTIYNVKGHGPLIRMSHALNLNTYHLSTLVPPTSCGITITQLNRHNGYVKPLHQVFSLLVSCLLLGVYLDTMDLPGELPLSGFLGCRDI